jgi:endonuclease-3
MSASLANAKSLATSRLKSASKLNKRVTAILDRLAKATPDPKCELYYKTPYQLLCSVILSAQATDKSVNKCMQPLYDEGLDLAGVLRLGEEGFLAKIRTIGLAPTKAKNILRMSKILLTEHDGKVPSTREALEALPGVGRKTASVVLGELFGEPTLAVDTHVYRVSDRLGLQHESTAEKAEAALLAIIPRKYLPKAHHWFILHGRYICVARAPKCEVCPLSDLCPSKLPPAGSPAQYSSNQNSGAGKKKTR